ncbi:c-type cytochrome [Nannocystis pusilla]|uniref:Cytochrome c n=1 Tax=Nannocystis pusilla TaxID=889268 RepID=A0ABS7TWX9_9BACT|nr:cytochrome c [Nannocystis pusilla]MBZ5712719.1 cytochrome c [Nannocystis pusilla]
MQTCYHQSLGALLFAGLAACQIPEPTIDGSGSGSDSDSDSAQGDSDADTGAVPVDDAARCGQLRANVKGLFTEKCAGCHANGATQGGLGTVTDLDSLIEDGLVFTGNAADSVLYRRLSAETGYMPQGGDRLAADELATVQDWIDDCTPIDTPEGAPSVVTPPGCTDNEPISTEAVLDAIRIDVAGLDLDRAATTRYLTFTHLHNAGYCEEQLDGYRHALAKLINHLSFGPDIITPVAIDPQRTIYRIDLIDYEWTAELWGHIVDVNPYSLIYEDQSAEVVQALTGAPVFSIVGDWFIDAASRPPLYHAILGIPETRGELEAQLGVDIEANLDREKELDAADVVRAGMQTSGVSRNNRVIERHEIPGSNYRGYWLSYDFASNSDPQAPKDILANPLDFVQDGGEIIFTLPNGLQGYMIVGADDRCLDSAPAEIVSDHESPVSPIVTNGVSCMGCHSEGMRLAVDDVRPYVESKPTAFPAAEREQILRLYGTREEFDAAQQRDIVTFVNATAETGAPRLVGGKEPVIAIHEAFDRDIAARRAAAEFGFTLDEVISDFGALTGLDKLPNAPVDRKVFQDNFCANAAALNLRPLRLDANGVCTPSPNIDRGKCVPPPVIPQ